MNRLAVSLFVPVYSNAVYCEIEHISVIYKYSMFYVIDKVGGTELYSLCHGDANRFFVLFGANLAVPFEV